MLLIIFFRVFLKACDCCHILLATTSPTLFFKFSYQARELRRSYVWQMAI